jgi:hypothetical protein
MLAGPNFPAQPRQHRKPANLANKIRSSPMGIRTFEVLA